MSISREHHFNPTTPAWQVSPNLHPDHLADLSRSGLMPDDFQRLGVGVWSLTPPDLERFLVSVGFGWALPCARSGYVLQYPLNGYYRVRLFWRDACQHKDKHPKYLGPAGRPTPAFVVEPVQALAKKRNQAVAVVEGEKKALSLCKRGVPAVGIGGCWCFRGPDGDLVEPLKAWDWRDRLIYLIPDGDWRTNPDVVQAWTTFGLLLAAKDAAPYVVTWDPDLGKGVDDAIVAGLNVHEAIQSAAPFGAWVAENARRFRSAVLSALASVDLPAGLADGLIRAVAKSRGVSHKAVRIEVRHRRNAKETKSDDIPDPEPTAEIRTWLCRPDLVDAVLDAVRQVHAGDDDNALALLLAWASLRFDDPVSVLIQGPPSTGKSHLLETLRSLWPPESYVFRSSLSPKALAYTDESLAHRAVVLAEAVSLVTSDESGYLVRTLLSEGRIVHESVEKTPSGLKAVKLEREGPTALFATTTRQKLEEQLQSRVWLLESKSDATYLGAALDAIAFGETQVPNADAIRKALSWLYHRGNPRVRIPNSLLQALRSVFPGRDPTELRVFKRLLASIRASAFLHQLRRPVDADGNVLATEDDYRIARRALAASFETATSDLTPRQREAWQAVRDLELPDGATLKDVARRLGIQKNSARELLKALITKGYLGQDPATRRYRTTEAPEPGVRLPEKLNLPPEPERPNGGPQNGPSSGSGAFGSGSERDPNDPNGGPEPPNGGSETLHPDPEPEHPNDGPETGHRTESSAFGSAPERDPNGPNGSTPHFPRRGDPEPDPPNRSGVRIPFGSGSEREKSSTEANSPESVRSFGSDPNPDFSGTPDPEGGPESRRHSAINTIAPGDDMAQHPSCPYCGGPGEPALVSEDRVVLWACKNVVSHVWQKSPNGPNDPAVQTVQVRSDRGPERQETAPVRDSGSGVQAFRSDPGTDPTRPDDLGDLGANVLTDGPPENGICYRPCPLSDSHRLRVAIVQGKPKWAVCEGGCPPPMVWGALGIPFPE